MPPTRHPSPCSQLATSRQLPLNDDSMLLAILLDPKCRRFCRLEHAWDCYVLFAGKFSSVFSPLTYVEEASPSIQC